jgi:glycosyltransferase involved in cell wall biosynthesis
MENKMHKTIAIVINTSWNIYNFRVGLLKALQEDGYKIIAIAPEDAYSEKLEALGFEYHAIKMNNKGTNPIEDIKLIWDFYKLYKKINPDVIFQYTIKPNIYGSMAGGMLGIPIISNISGLGTVFLSDNFSSKIARFLYRIALKVPKKVFYQNKHDQALFIESGLVDVVKTGLLPGSGIDTNKFRPNYLAKKRDDNVVRFLFIARLVRDKGLQEYVEASKEIYLTKKLSIECAILGGFYPGNPTAISEKEMEDWEEEGIVRYLGTSDDVRTVMSNYDCIVLPSYREGLSRVLLEAASMAKPIITTNVPGCKEVVDDGINGYLCEVKDSVSLADKIEKMSSLSDVERVEMGRKGREKVIEKFDEKIVIQKYKEALLEIFDQQS